LLLEMKDDGRRRAGLHACVSTVARPQSASTIPSISGIVAPVERRIAGNRIRAAYFLLQAVATLGWWLLIAVSPGWRAAFAFGDDGGSLRPFLAADLVFWCAGSLAVGHGEWHGNRWTGPARLLLCGAMTSSVLHAASLAIISGAGWPGVVLMLPALITTLWLARRAACSTS